MLVMAGLLAGAMNAIAGGGSFVTFPALVFVGLPPVIANATSTVALLPGTIASSWAYRKGIGGIGGLPMRVLLPVTLVGGLIGALVAEFPNASGRAVKNLLKLTVMAAKRGAEVDLALFKKLAKFQDIDVSKTREME